MTSLGWPVVLKRTLWCPVETEPFTVTIHWVCCVCYTFIANFNVLRERGPPNDTINTVHCTVYALHCGQRRDNVSIIVTNHGCQGLKGTSCVNWLNRTILEEGKLQVLCHWQLYSVFLMSYLYVYNKLYTKQKWMVNITVAPRLQAILSNWRK